MLILWNLDLTDLVQVVLKLLSVFLSDCLQTVLGSPENGGPENIPPVGVFWDIENCSVPSGRSAGAVVERIRSHFFQGHREAEFICVCDISKESKAVIQELNNCQVPLYFMHISHDYAINETFTSGMNTIELQFMMGRVGHAIMWDHNLSIEYFDTWPELTFLNIFICAPYCILGVFLKQML